MGGSSDQNVGTKKPPYDTNRESLRREVNASAAQVCGYVHSIVHED
jgi:hypothetical protein